jgi:hypothetical protein
MRAVIWKNVGVLRGIAITMVVVNHTVRNLSSLYVYHNGNVDPRQDFFNTAWIVTLRVLTPFCVPAFIFSTAFFSHRFLRSTKQARKSALTLTRHYLVWSIPLFIALALFRGSFDAKATFIQFINGGPPTAYWFIIVILQLLLVFPILSSLATDHSRGLFAAMIGLQLIVWTGHYTGLIARVPTEYAFIIRPVLFMPIFIAGLLVGKYSKQVLGFFEPRRKWLVLGLVVSFIWSFAETWVLASAENWSLVGLTQAVAEERVPATLFALFVIAGVLTRKSHETPRSRWFTALGMASFGIFLMVDIFLRIGLSLVWRLCDLYASSEQFLIIGVPLLALMGIIGPLSTMKLGGHILGSRARYFW